MIEKLFAVGILAGLLVLAGCASSRAQQATLAQEWAAYWACYDEVEQRTTRMMRGAYDEDRRLTNGKHVLDIHQRQWLLEQTLRKELCPLPTTPLEMGYVPPPSPFMFLLVP